MLVADKEHPDASHSLESHTGQASPALFPYSAVVSSSALLCFTASLPLAHLPSTRRTCWGDKGEPLAKHPGKGRRGHTPSGLLLSSPGAALSPLGCGWLPRGGGLQQQW